MGAAEFPFPVSTHTTTTDAMLAEALRACARRSVPALQRIYDLTAPRLLGELTQRLGDRQAAEAALEDCYVKIWQQAGSFSPERCRPGTWLMSIARQHAVGLRDQQPTPPEEVDATLQLADAALGEQESATPEMRILRLAYASGRSTAEIARALGMPARRIRECIHHALQSLGVATKAVTMQGRVLQQLAGGYAVGSLSPRTRRRFETWLERDLSARRAWHEWEERLSDLVPPLPPVRPAAQTWQQIESRVGTKPQPRRRTARRWVLLAALLVGVAAVLILARP